MPTYCADKVLYWLLPDRLGDVPEHGKVLTEARDSVQTLIDELWAAGAPQLVHGDLTAANVIEAPGVGPVPIDFQDMVVGFPRKTSRSPSPRSGGATTGTR